VQSLLSSTAEHLIETYTLPKCPLQVQNRAAFLLAEISSHFGLQRVKLSSDLRLQLQDLVLDLFHQTRASMVHYGV
jgi:hypothetical protein